MRGAIAALLGALALLRVNSWTGSGGATMEQVPVAQPSAVRTADGRTARIVEKTHGGWYVVDVLDEEGNFYERVSRQKAFFEPGQDHLLSRALPPLSRALPPAAYVDPAQTAPNKQNGNWSKQEHQQFLDLMEVHGRSWMKIARCMDTRTVTQVRSHAQKHFIKLEKEANGGGAPAPPKPRVSKPRALREKREPFFRPPLPMREKLIKWKLSGCTVTVTPITVIDTREHIVRALDFPDYPARPYRVTLVMQLASRNQQRRASTEEY